MTDLKISQLTDGGLMQPGDQVAVARTDGFSYRVRPGTADGWLDDTNETWTYASGSGGGVATFTVPGDLTAKYIVGTRIKLTQTTVKYFVITADPTFDGTNTTVTINAGTDYTLANAAISANYHSYQERPQGYPGWFNFAGAATGFSATTTTIYRFRVSGRTCSVVVIVTGTSNATTLTWTLPVAAVQALNIPHAIVNSGTTALGRSVTAAASTTVTVSATIAAGAFTASGTKTTNESWFYEI